MALDSMLRRGVAVVAFGALALFTLPARPARALRMVDYNLLNYPGTNAAIRDPYYRTIFATLSADFMVGEEITSQVGVDGFRTNVLNTLEPGLWLSAPFVDGNDTDCAFFYKPSKVQYLGQWAFYPNPLTNLRLIHVYRFKPVGYAATPSEIRVYAMHLKASSGGANESARALEASGLRDTLDALPAGVNAIAAGDFNFYRSTEPAMDTLQAVRASSRGRLYDPLNLVGAWQDNASMAIHHTQCPSTTAYRPTGGYSGGGLDDRFDLFLPTYDLRDGDAVDLLASTYIAVGNDGQHMNKSMTDPPIAPADTALARALWWGSDHLPIRVDLRLPAKIQAPSTPLAFGTVIVGAPSPALALGVSNSAAAPADTLEYAYAAPIGFNAPAGPLALLVGGASNDAISMDASSAGNKSGTLVLGSNDLDSPSLNIAVSGTVLDHAIASLDPFTPLTSTTLDFGDAPAGTFEDQPVSVYNQDYHATRARLSLAGAAITGAAAARFSFTPAFTPALVAETSADYGLHFDDTGAPADSTYEADLAFTSSDEPLPGAGAQPTLNVHLRAHITSGTVAVPRIELPTTTRLYAPFPNPLVGFSTVRFDLAHGAHATLQVFDLSGRRVATLADHEFPAGAFTLRWNGRHDDGRSLGAGIYFVRLSGNGIPTQSARLAVIE